MDELIIRSFQGNTSAADEQRLIEWRVAAPADEQRYTHLRQLWELAAVLEDRSADESVPTIQELERSAKKPSEQPSLPRRQSQPRFVRSRNALKIAALVLLGFATRHFIPSGDASIALGAAEFVTGASETVTVTLGDGTLIRLAPQSRLRLRGGNTNREVWLDGRAYFAVTQQDGRPFRVRTHAGDAMVLGTRFDLQAQEGKLRLLVVEGEVELASRGTTVAIGASELSEVVGSAPPTLEKVDPEYVHDSLRWMGEFIVFEATPLSQAAQELSLHYDTRIEVLDSTLAKETVFGTFVDEDLEDILNVICRAMRAHCSLRPDGVTIEP